MNNNTSYSFIDRGKYVDLGNAGLRNALHKAILYQIDIWKEFGGVRNAPYVLSSIFQRDGDMVQNIDSRIVRNVMKSDFPEEFKTFVTEAEQQVDKALQNATLNAKHVKLLEPEWHFNCVYVSDEDQCQTVRYDRTSKIVHLGLQDDLGNTLASVGIVLEKGWDGEMCDPGLCAHKFYVDGEAHRPAFDTELFVKLETVGRQFLDEHHSMLIAEYLVEDKEQKKKLPVSKVPGITAVYEYVGLNDQKLVTPLVDAGRSEHDLTEMLKAVLLKDIYWQTNRFFLYESDPDPDKFDRLAQQFNRQVAVTDGKEVVIARSSLSDIAGIEKDHLSITAKVLDSLQIVKRTPVLNQTSLTRMLPFDCDYWEALEYGNYLPNQEKQNRQSHSR